jgi:hypothetical protein
MLIRKKKEISISSILDKVILNNLDRSRPSRALTSLKHAQHRRVNQDSICPPSIRSQQQHGSSAPPTASATRSAPARLGR